MADLFSSVFGSLIGAGAQAFGAQAGGQAISSAAQDANQTRLNFYNSANGALEPYQMAGKAALPTLQGLTTPGESANYLSQMPGYQFLLDQGQKATQNGFAAQGLGSSEAAMKGGISFAEGLAGTSLQQQFDMLMKQAGLGEQAAGAMANNAMATGAGIGENLLTSGKGWAAADMATGNAIGQGATGASAMNQQQQMLDILAKKYGIGGDTTAGGAPSAMLNPNLSGPSTMGTAQSYMSMFG